VDKSDIQAQTTCRARGLKFKILHHRDHLTTLTTTTLLLHTYIMATATATLTTPREELVESLERHNATFTKLLSLIPARFYLPPDQEELDSRWMKNKKRRTGEEIKEHKRKAKADKVGLPLHLRPLYRD